MLKKYTSKSNISISVLLKNKKSGHVSFSPITGGGSVFYTEDVELQAALEKHVKFGRLFKLDTTFATPTKKAVVTDTTAGVEDESQEDECQETGETDENSETEDSLDTAQDNGATETSNSATGNLNISKIHVDSLDDAKEYLSEHFGISRTKLRSKKAILDAAAANSVVFVGIE